MMAMAGPPGECSFLPLLEPLEDSSAGHSEQIDAYLTIAKCVPKVIHQKSCTANYNPSDSLAILMLTSYAKKGNEMLCFDLFSSTSRLGGEEARQFLPAVEQYFSRLGKVILVSFYVFGVIKSMI